MDKTTQVYRVVIMTEPGNELVKYYLEPDFDKIKDLINQAANNKANVRLLNFNETQLKSVGLKAGKPTVKDDKK